MKNFIVSSILLFPVIVSLSQNDHIDVNNINAVVSPSNVIFQTLAPDTIPYFEANKGSGISTIYTSSFWMAGIRKSDSVYCGSFQSYKSRFIPNSFSTGPLTCISGSGSATKKDYGAATIDSIQKAKWDKVFCITKNEIEEFKHWFACSRDVSCNTAILFPGYTIPNSILDWPAHGDVSEFQDFYLAPFWDNDADGFYDPTVGDFPCIKGDKYCWYIINDRGVDTSRNEMGVEIHVEMYSFIRDSLNPLNNVIFLGQDIINRSRDTFNDLFVSQFTDFDIGCAQDDYIGSIQSLNSYYGYNGDSIDDNCPSNFKPYGNYPPAQGVTFLNKTMTSSLFYNNSTGAFGKPNNIIEAHRIMNGKRRDGTSQKYYNTTSVTKYAYPYIAPTGMPIWTEHSAGNPAGDRRMLGSVGGFTFTPGDVIEVDLAFTYSRSDSGHLKSVDQLYRDIQVVQAFYNDSIKPCSDSLIGSVSIMENKNDVTFSMFPNPTQNFVTINVDGNSQFDLKIIDIQGKTILIKKQINSAETIDLTHLISGIYLVQINDKNGATAVKKLIVQ